MTTLTALCAGSGALPRLRRCLALAFATIAVIGLAGCARSVVLLQPAEVNGQRVATQNAQGEVNLELRFHARADTSTFEAELDPGTNSARLITSEFPATGNPRSATVAMPPGSRSIRIAARMSPGQAFDSTANTQRFTVRAAPQPPPPPTPRVDMTVTPLTAQVVWGQSASYEVRLTSANGFNGPVTVAADQLPSGAGPASAVVNLAAGQTTTSVLSVPTASAATVQGVTPFRIRATSSAITRSSNQQIVVLGNDGAFTRLTHRFANETCNPGVAAVYSQAGVNAFQVQFTAGGQTGQASPAVFYAFAPAACRVGIVMHPCQAVSCTGAGDPAISWFNLAWPAATGAPALRSRIGNQTRINWHQFWLSPDQNLLLVLTKREPPVACPPTCPHMDLRAFLYDAISGLQLAVQDLRAKIVPGSAADPRADIQNAVLSGRTVTINFIDQNGNPDSRTLAF